LALEAEALAARIVERNVVRRRMEGYEHGWDKGKKLGAYEEEVRSKAYGVAVDMLRL
jgi:predicted kinase